MCVGLDWFVVVPVHTSQYWTILEKKWKGLYGSSGMWHMWRSQPKLKFPPARRIEKNSWGWRRSFGVKLGGSPYSIYPGCFQPYNIFEEMECNKLLGYRLYKDKEVIKTWSILTMCFIPFDLHMNQVDRCWIKEPHMLDLLCGWVCSCQIQTVGRAKKSQAKHSDAARLCLSQHVDL